MSEYSEAPPEDLSVFLRHLHGVKASTRRRLANDERTREILAAALRLLDRQFAPVTEPDESRPYPFFQWLSRRKIAVEVVEARTDLPEYERDSAADSTTKLLERRWSSHDHFLKDFLGYAIGSRTLSHRLSSTSTTPDLLDPGGDLYSSIQQISYADLALSTSNASIQRMHLLATILAERDPEISQVLVEQHQRVDQAWAQVFQLLLDRYGWQLRPGVTVEQVTLLLTTAAEGMSLRAMVDPTGIIDRETRHSLLGVLGAVITMAVIDPGDGRSIDEVVRDVGRGAWGRVERGEQRSQPDDN